jgi:hypothetical protein
MRLMLAWVKGTNPPEPSRDSFQRLITGSSISKYAPFGEPLAA